MVAGYNAFLISTIVDTQKDLAKLLGAIMPF